MKIETKFIADDGRPFDDEKECVAYEQQRLLGIHAGFVAAVRTALVGLTESSPGGYYRIPFDSETDFGRDIEAVAVALSLNWEALAAARNQATLDAFGPEELATAVVNSGRRSKHTRKTK